MTEEEFDKMVAGEFMSMTNAERVCAQVHCDVRTAICKVCGETTKYGRWICDDCNKFRKEDSPHILNVCQNCGHHKFDHYSYEPKGRCVKCTCDHFVEVRGRF